MDVDRARPNVRARQPENPRAGVPYLIPFLGGGLGISLFQDTIREYFGGGDGDGLSIEAVLAIVAVVVVLLLVVAS